MTHTHTIFDAIRAKGLSVAEVARQAELSRPTVYAACDPESNANTETLAAIAEVLGMDLSRFSEAQNANVVARSAFYAELQRIVEGKQ